MPQVSSSRLPLSRGWTIVLPFKGGASAKSRLGQSGSGCEGFRPEVRHRLALAFLCDTVATAAAAPEVGNVVVVSSDPALESVLPDVDRLDDPGQGLNAAVSAGVEWVRSRNPLSAVAALTADLPSLTMEDLTLALALAAQRPLALVSDRHGSGSTMISALPGVQVTPRFGVQSCAAHIQAGHEILPIPAASTLRADVDTFEDLAEALQRGVGENTRAALQQSSQHYFYARFPAQKVSNYRWASATR
jgi:2-phospho-L-lactate/phosphoenolpyruvate guanylyltransferase